MLNINCSHLILLALFLTAFAFTMEKSSDQELIFLFDEIELNQDSCKFKYGISTSLSTIPKEIKFVDLPVEVVTLEQAIEAQTKFGEFAHDGNKTKEEKKLAKSYFNTLGKKYNAYFIIKDKRAFNQKTQARLKRLEYINAAAELVEAWHNLKH